MEPKKVEEMLNVLDAISGTLGDGLLNKENNFEGTDVSVLAEIRNSLDEIKMSLDFLSEVIEKGFMYLAKNIN